MRTWLTHLAVTTAAFLAVVSNATSHTKDAVQNQKGNQEESVQRTAPTSAFDLQRNVVSNIDFYTTNYGIFGYNVLRQVGGTFWPRGRQNQYLFAGGAWFGALKRPPGATDLRKRVMITYNPNSGQSWMVPGSIADGRTVDQSTAAIGKNRVYFSTDFNLQDGTDIYNPTLPKWPVWDSSPNDTLRVENYYGYYINNPDDRVRTLHPKGPAFISQEDIFCVYKDTDLSRYEGGALRRQAEGFPLGFQIEQMIYSWGFGDYADMVFLKYLFIRPTTFTDTLFQCWMAAVMDVDIALGTNPVGGAQNDRARYYNEEDTLNLAVQWTNADRGEANQGFGYLGFNFLESPAVDADGYLRKDRKQFPVSEQLGLRTMRNWPITVDPIENDDRYNFMSAGSRDGDDGPGDRRLLMATGPFNMRPGDSARIVVGIILGATATGRDATGTAEDMSELIRKVRFAQFVYNNQFRAPQAPELSKIAGYSGDNLLYSVPAAGWLPLNNAIVIQWDSTAELSVDTLESGLDFLGYRVYRARRTDLDTFAQDFQRTARKGPLGWKQIAQYQIPFPFLKSTITTELAKIPLDELDIADIIRPGQKRFLVARRPSAALPWGGYYNNLLNRRSPTYTRTLLPDGSLNPASFDKFDSVQLIYLTTTVEELPTVNRAAASAQNPWGVDTTQAKAAKDSLIKLILAKKVKADPFKFTDTAHVRDSQGNPTIITLRRPWEETNEVRRGIIAPYMKQITSGRQLFDAGDDDRNGQISYDPDPEKSERLINNTDYYYAIRAFDEGDYLLDSESKLNIKGVGLSNTVTAMPLGSRPGGESTIDFRLDPDQAARLGGIYNIKLLINDKQRFNQIFSGKTLELEFFRTWVGIDHDRNAANAEIGFYGLLCILRDSATKTEVAQWSSLLPPQICGGGAGLNGYFTENAETWVDVFAQKDRIDSATGMIFDTVLSPINGQVIRVDTTSFHLPNNTEKVIRSGSFFTNAVCLPNQYALATVGLSFDYSIEQFGGVYRNASGQGIISGGDPNIYVGGSRVQAKTYEATNPLSQPPAYFEPPYPGWQPSANFFWPVSYNNGPGVYEVTFEEGGVETITTSFQTSTLAGDPDGSGRVATFQNVPYLNMKVRNVYSFDRPDVSPSGTVGTVPVSYPFDLTLAQPSLSYAESLGGPSARNSFPNPELVPPGSYAIAAYGWRNSNQAGIRSVTVRFHSADSGNGRPIGTPGRYYKSRNLSTTGQDTLDFTHVVTIGGAQFVIDFSRFGRRSFTSRVAPDSVSVQGATDGTRPTLASTDFKPGDKIRFYTAGGAFGYPFDNTKVYARIGQYDPEVAGRPYNDSELEQVQVVPNPFYVTHEGMRSPYEGRLYFTRLPRKATIKIYTINGELVTSYEHDETTSDDPSTFGTYVWDLMTKNRQRVSSQMLVAKIETPDGASVVRKFTLVLGPARIIQE